MIWDFSKYTMAERLIQIDKIYSGLRSMAGDYFVDMTQNKHGIYNEVTLFRIMKEVQTSSYNGTYYTKRRSKVITQGAIIDDKLGLITKLIPVHKRIKTDINEEYFRLEQLFSFETRAKVWELVKKVLDKEEDIEKFYHNLMCDLAAEAEEQREMLTRLINTYI
jgi:hypothetical protein